jgi:lipopolysaccharide export system permease protein
VKILTRYILREHLGPLLFAVSALTALLLLQQVAKQFGNLVGKGLSWAVIGEVFYLSVPFIVAMTLPMAVLVAVLYAFSRLSAENEVTALRASGVGIVRLVRPVIIAGAVLAAGMLLFNDQVLSRSNHRLRTLQTDIARKKPTFALREQVINEVLPGKIFLKAGHIDPATNKLREVFIYNFEDPMHRKTIYADSGQMGLTADQGTLQLLLHNGYMIEVPRDNPGTLQRLYFTTDLVRVRGVANQFQKTDNDTYKSEREMSMCEMDAQFQRGARQLDVARQELATLLQNTVRSAVGAPPALPTAEAPSRTRTTSGDVYCSLITKVLGAGSVKVAQAAPPPIPPSQDTAAQPAPQQQAAPAPQPETANAARPRAAGLPRLAQREGAATDTPAVNTPVMRPVASEPLAVTMGQIDVMKARITDARTMMNRYQVEIQKKFALAAACIVFVVFGAPLALRFPRGGVGLVIGVSIVAFAIYYVCLIAGETLANKLILSPVLAMWAANILFLILGIVLLVRVQRSGSTARGGDAREAWDTFRIWGARQVARVEGALRWRRRSTA